MNDDTVLLKYLRKDSRALVRALAKRKVVRLITNLETGQWLNIAIRVHGVTYYVYLIRDNDKDIVTIKLATNTSNVSKFTHSLALGTVSTLSASSFEELLTKVLLARTNVY